MKLLLFILCLASLVFCQQATLELGNSTSVLFLPREDYLYFALPTLAEPLTAEQSLVFVVSPLSAGDVDIYVSTHTPTPNVKNYDYKSVGQAGIDAVFINATYYTHAQHFVGVRAYHADTTFTLIAYLSDKHIYIKDGIPQISSVKQGKYTYFAYYVSTTGWFTVSNTAITGNPDIYISSLNPKPSTSSYEYKMSLAGSDILTIYHSGAPKYYYIGIYGSTYAIFNLDTTHADTRTHLADAMPLRQIVVGYAIQYYKYNLTIDSPLTITATKRSTWGDPDIYVSTTTETPNPNNFIWRAWASGSDSVTIQPGTPGYRLGYFYIGVRDDSTFSVTFDLLVKTQLSHTVLTAGRPQNAESEQGKYDYYKFYYSGTLIDGSLDLVASASNGRVTVVASKTSLYPTLTDKQYIGAIVGSASSVHINPVTEGWYYIGVYSNEPSNYTITAAASDDPIYLVNGRPVNFYVERAHFKPFVFDVNDTLDVSISLQVSSGDADLYVGIKERTYIWYSVLAYGTDVITIPKDDPWRYVPDFKGRFYIYVHGYLNSYFTVTAHVGNATIELLNGVPIAGNVKYNDYTYYSYYMTQAGRLSFNLQVSPGTGNNADLYISRRTSRPTSQLYEYKSTGLGSDFVSIDATPGYFWIGVLGATAPNVSYTISGTADYEALATNGLSIIDSVPKGTYRYYTTTVSWSNLYSTLVTAGVTLISGATKMYMLNNGSFPSASSYRRRDESWPGNMINVDTARDIAIVENATTTWTYAVYGVDDSLYYIHSSLNNPWQGILRPGEPKIGHVNGSRTSYFRFANGVDVTKNYYLNVALLNYLPYSSLSIFIDQAENIPTETSNVWNVTTAYDTLIPITKSGFRTPNPLIVGVKMQSTASQWWMNQMRFILTLSSEDDPVYLTQEQPHEVQAEVGKAYSFAVYIPRDATGLTIFVRSCTNAVPPRIYVSRNNRHPSSADYDYKSDLQGKYSQALYAATGVTGIVPNVRYFIGTDVMTENTVFTIYAFTKDDLRPRPGNQGRLNVFGTVAVGKVQIAIPALEFAHQPAQYLVYKRVLQGAETADNVNMETVCAVTKTSTLVNRVDVPPNMPPTLYTDVPVNYKEKCIVNIIAEDTYRLKGLYNPLFFVTNEFNELGRGLPMRGLANDTMVYFVIPKFDTIDLSRTDISLVISVTPLVGDVDIYVSNTGRPTKDEYLWKGTQGGFDILKIYRNDPKWNYGPYVVGIVAAGGSKLSSFSIMSYINPIDNIVLFDGQPQVAESAYNQFTYFNFTLDDNSTLSISGTPLYGDVDLVVSTVTSRPTRQNREWAASLGGLDVLTIENTDPKYKPLTTYYIGAYGWSYTQYAITATKKFSIALLNEGIPQGATLKSEMFAYYRFEVIDDRGLSITVTPTTSDGDPDIFVSTIHTRPSLFRSEWSSQQSGADSIVIDKSDPHWRKSTYYIAVRAYRTDCSFQILVVSSEGASLVAVDGVPQNVYARQGAYTYFRFYHGYQDNRISFTTTPRSLGAGPIEIYMSRSFAKPDSTKFERKSQLQGAISVLNIATGSPVGWYYLGIVPTAANVNYTFTASTNQVPLLLIDGQIRVDNYVPSGFTKYFVFQLTQPMLSMDLVVALSAAFGDPDMYVSWNTTRPSPTNYQWKSDRAGGDSITIHAGEIPTFVRRLNVAIFAYTATRFSIVGFSSNQTMVLQDATGLPGRISTYRYNQYVYEMRNAGRLKFNLELTSPFPADANLYVSRSPNPSAANFDWKSTKFGVDFVIIDNATPGKYYIAVQGVSGNIAASYVLTASSEYEYLTDGQALIEFVSKGQTRVFKTYISDYAHHVLTAVTLINGRTELYGCVNCTGRNITKDTADFVATGWPGNAIYVANSDRRFHGGEWTFVVNALENSDFFVSIQTREGRLNAGQPRRGATVPGTPIYYMFALDIGASSQQDYYINIKTFHSTNCVRVFASQKFERPNRTHTTWYGVSDPKQESHSIMWLPKNEIDWSEPALYIGVEACNPIVPRQGAASTYLVDYEIVVSSVNDPLYITQDFADVYPSQQAKHFAMLSSQHAAALHVELMSCTRQTVRNSIRLYATSNQSVPYPDANTAEFTAVPSNDYTLLITSDKVKNNAKYWINMVTGTIPSTFVYSIFSTTRSRDPRPVAGGGFGARDNNLLKLDKASVQAADNNMLNVQFSLSFVPAKPSSIMSDDRNNRLTYDVVALNLDKDLDEKERQDTPENKLKKTNYQTPCSIRFNTNTYYIGNISASIATPPPSVITLNPSFSVPATGSNNVWVINVIVRDEATGLEATYVPILFPVSLFDDTYQWFSIGATLILIFVTLFMAYLFIGSCVNVVKYKKRGIEAIPNVEFWRDLPVLVKDGFMYTVCCCRVQKQYAAFVDEPTDVPADVIINNSASQNNDDQGYPVDAQDQVTDEDDAVHDNPFQQQTDKSGYGAI